MTVARTRSGAQNPAYRPARPLTTSVRAGGELFPQVSGLLLFGLGAGIAMPAATDSVMNAVPSAEAGVGSAVNDTSRELGAALGVAVVGSVAATAYTTTMRAQTEMPAMTDGVRAAVEDNIGAALTTSSALGADGVGLAQAAQDAFVVAMGGALWVAAAVAVWGSVVAVVHLPRHPAPTVGP